MNQTMDEKTPYNQLGPGDVLDAVESAGFRPDGHLLVMNSYENRVYQVGLEEGPPIIAKFYRPHRWSDAAILEEHDFSARLADLEIPVVAPMANDQGETLHRHGPFRFSLSPRKGGREPELDDMALLRRLGHFLGRLHQLGGVRPFVHRPTLDAASFGLEPGRFLLENGFIPPEHISRYENLLARLLEGVEECYQRAGKVAMIRLHGDCHVGNILWRDGELHLVDLDDARNGPAIQDLWLFLSGSRQEQAASLAVLLDGYARFRDFNPRELHLIEALRTLRMIHHAGWIARRWDDPAFVKAFPWFNEPRYWQDHLQHLEEQLHAMAEEPLPWLAVD